MFCSNCGAQCADGTKFCQSCGTPLNAAPAPEATAAPAAPKAPKAKTNAVLGNLAPTIRPFLALILAGVAVLALVLFVLNTFGILHIPATVKMMGMKETEYGKISEIAEAWKQMDKSLACVYIGNILFGIVNLAIAAVGALYFLKKQSRMPYYDQFVGKYLKVKNPAFYMGAAGVAGVILQVIFFAFCGISESMSSFGMSMTVKMSIGIPWLNWVAFAIYAIVGAMGFLVFNNED